MAIRFVDVGLAKAEPATSPPAAAEAVPERPEEPARDEDRTPADDAPVRAPAAKQPRREPRPATAAERPTPPPTESPAQPEPAAPLLDPQLFPEVVPERPAGRKSRRHGKGFG